MKYKQWPKRDPVKNYFQLPNEIFLLGLSPGALVVYSYLLCCENRNTFRNITVNCSSVMDVHAPLIYPIYV